MHLDNASYVGTHLLPENIPMPGPEEVEKATQAARSRATCQV